MASQLYDKTVCCPVCSTVFSTKKVRSRGLQIVERQDDLNVIYKDVNPNLYYVWVCPECGFSGSEGEYENFNPICKKIFEEKIRSKWNKRSYCGIRSHKEAEESYKLAILIAQLCKKQKSYIGILCLKLAWIYREEKNDKKEIEFLNHALSNLTQAYQEERLENSHIDEVTAAYLVGELNRRLGNFKEAIHWYSKTLEHPEIKRKRQLQLKTRDQWRLAKEQYDNEKTSTRT
jgi:uncharacterized protein (DUF2225 family)